jgi:adenosylcobinamide-GDP ribazoletransferase
MKDSFIGVYAVIGLIFIFLLKISILSTLPTTTVPFVLFSGHSISRLFPLLLMQRYNYVRESDSKAVMYFWGVIFIVILVVIREIV